MKKISIVLYAVLFLAVGVLYFLNFSGKSGNKKSNVVGSVVESSAKGIAFVNIDSVIFKFEMFSDRRADLLTKQKNAEAELN